MARKKLPYVKYGFEPSKKRWERVATEEALAHGCNPVRLLAGAKAAGYALVRFQAWKRLYEEGASYSGLARVSGFDHSSIIWGVKRASGLSPREIYQRKPSSHYYKPSAKHLSGIDHFTDAKP